MSSILDLPPDEFLFALDELGLPDDQREFLLSRYGVSEPRPPVPDDRSFGYHLLDNLIGFDDDYVTRGEELKAGIRDTLSAVASDPLGAARAVAEGTYDLIDRGVRGEATPLEMLELATMVGTGPMTAARGISGLADYDPTVVSIFGSRGSRVPEAQRAMDMAERMREAGATAEEIWRATGQAEGYPAVFLPGRDDPLFEFSDDRMRYADPVGAASGDPFALRGLAGDIIRHDELFRHYPDMRTLETDLAADLSAGDLGEFVQGILADREPDTVRVSSALPLPSRLEVLGHELQHGVARLDPSVPQGFSLEDADRLYQRDLYWTDRMGSLFQGLLRRENEALDPLRRRLTGGEHALRSDLQSIVDSYNQYRGALTDRYEGLEALPEGYGSESFGYGMYTRTPGEALARLAEARLGMQQQSRINDPAFTALRNLEGLGWDNLTELRSTADVPRSFGLGPRLGTSPSDMPAPYALGIFENALETMLPRRQRELEAALENLPEGVSRTEMINRYRDMLSRDIFADYEAKNKELFLDPYPTLGVP